MPRARLGPQTALDLVGVDIVWVKRADEVQYRVQLFTFLRASTLLFQHSNLRKFTRGEDFDL